MALSPISMPSQTSNSIECRSAGWIYRSFGVEPIVNCAGVRTNYGASNPADEVIEAMNAAAQAFVDLDELADGVGRKLAALTGAEWGLVTAGTASSLALAAAACIAGNEPEAMLRLPDSSGSPNKVVIPADQRFAYEQAIRVAGAEIVSVATLDELTATIADGQVAMICLLGRMDGTSALPLDAVLKPARSACIPILVNAAGLSPSNSDRWTGRGADLVVYAGGKYLRGPQSTAIVLGSRSLCEAMWWNAAPHQAFGRCMKVGKEEMVGAVVALDRWINSPAAKTERDRWLPRLETIAGYLVEIPGVETKILSWAGSVTATRLEVRWDQATIPFEAETLRLALLDQRPRILLHDFWSTPTSIIVDPINLSDPEADTVGSALAAVFRDPTALVAQPQNEPAAVDVSGAWRLEVAFLHHSQVHRFDLQQDGSIITGLHRTNSSSGHVAGEIHGRQIVLDVEHPRTPIHLFYRFEGEVAADGTMCGMIRFGGATPEHRGPVFKAQYGPGAWRCAPIVEPRPEQGHRPGVALAGRLQ